MPLTLEVSYFNSYYVKRLADVPYIPDVGAERNAVTTGSVPAGSNATFGGTGIGTPVVGMAINGAGVVGETKIVTVNSNQTIITFDKDVTFTSGLEWQLQGSNHGVCAFGLGNILHLTF